ncbi:hypothetical protein V8C34DRAFT_299258 [Trichoderma compactum]
MIKPKIHPHFLGAELRLSRYILDKAVSLFRSILRGRNYYSGIVRDNLAWTAAVTACMVLILTVMQVVVAMNGFKTTLPFNGHNMSSQCLQFGCG